MLLGPLLSDRCLRRLACDVRRGPNKSDLQGVTKHLPEESVSYPQRCWPPQLQEIVAHTYAIHDHCLPRTGAYHEIFLMHGQEMAEKTQILGPTLGARRGSSPGLRGTRLRGRGRPKEGGGPSEGTRSEAEMRDGVVSQSCLSARAAFPRAWPLAQPGSGTCAPLTLSLERLELRFASDWAGAG